MTLPVPLPSHSCPSSRGIPDGGTGATSALFSLLGTNSTSLRVTLPIWCGDLADSLLAVGRCGGTAACAVAALPRLEARLYCRLGGSAAAGAVPALLLAAGAANRGGNAARRQDLLLVVMLLAPLPSHSRPSSGGIPDGGTGATSALLLLLGANSASLWVMLPGDLADSLVATGQRWDGRLCRGSVAPPRGKAVPTVRGLCCSRRRPGAVAGR